MSIKHNEFGEVISVNGLTTGQHLGKPMQDAIAERPEDNEAYGTQRRTVGRMKNCKDEEQPKVPGGGSGGTFVVNFTEEPIEDSDMFKYTADKTFAEIKTALNAGRYVYGVLNGAYICDLVTVATEWSPYFSFSSCEFNSNPTYNTELSVNEDNTVEVWNYRINLDITWEQLG